MHSQENLGSPYTSMLTAGNDHYHAVCSINKYGAIAHTHALARLYVKRQLASDEWEALEMARMAVNQTRRLASGEQLNKEAHAELKATAKQKAKGLGRQDNSGFLAI
jgi:hypothetical protein